MEIDDTIENDPTALIPQLCNLFYNRGWMVGSGGAISIRKGENIYMSPSGVQKELIKPHDVFVVDHDGKIIRSPSNQKLSVSTCLPSCMKAFKLRNAHAVYHTHSPAATLITILYPGKEFRISHQQYLKAIPKCTEGRNYGFEELLVVPIVENPPLERDVNHVLTQAMDDYPDSCAVLIRRHGIYVWGASWQKAKVIIEAYDFLFDIAAKMKLHGLDPAEPPVFPEGAYVYDTSGSHRYEY